jgi:uncharacterized OsmC-like protein
MTPHSNPIREAVDRVRRALARSETVGRGTARTRARIQDGLTCEVEDGPWRLTVDMPEKVGGGGQGPDPGVLGRGALASCLAVGYAVWAAHEGVPLDVLEVEVEADYDARPEYGIGGDDPGYDALRWEVRVESSAPEERVLQVLATAEARSPWLAVFRDSQEIQRTVRITSPVED